MNLRRSRKRGTRVAQRVGTPVVLTTTTNDVVFEDDETRFLSCWTDTSPEQSLAIMKARAKRHNVIDRKDLSVWQAAMSALKLTKGDFEHPPKWLQYVASHLPLQDPRVRRDWDRFLTFCSAIALCRSFRRKHAH